jgi:hypothetical protein
VKKLAFLLAVLFLGASLVAAAGLATPAKLQQLESEGKVSPQTQACLACHMRVTPGIVMDWLNSKHATNAPPNVQKLYEAIGAGPQPIAAKFKDYKYVVGCYECHGMYKVKDRVDAVNHFGFKIVTIVTMQDCSQCHPKEAKEISWTWHAFAALNTNLNPWYKKVVKYAKDHGELDILPPVFKLTHKGLITWDWYKDYAKALYDYLNGKPVSKEWLNYIKTFGTPYDYDFKNIISPLYPASGGLNTTVAAKVGYKPTIGAVCSVGKWNYFEQISNPMSHPMFKNAYAYHACYECHGTLVVPYKTETKMIKGFPVTRMDYWGWPTNGAGRIDPDGSLGTCTACHPRHSFSIAQAREPWTCGQCHLGYDHPHIEIYEESKHGNIFDANKEKWNMEALPWKVGTDFNAPTCATCHMSTIASPDGSRILVKGTHDLRARLVWDQMHFFTYPKADYPDNVQLAVIKGVSVLTGANIEKAVSGSFKVIPGPKAGELAFPRLATIEYSGALAQKRAAMEKVCTLCHSTQWTKNFFRTADQNMIDYDIVAHYAFDLLKKAWKEGIENPHNKLDEYMEVQWYYIWHHQGRRWRNGAYMMGPDFAHWFGIVDTVMQALNSMLSYYQMAKQVHDLQLQLQSLAK